MASRTEEFGAVSRGQTFSYDPKTLVLVRDKSHPLYDPSVDNPVPEKLVRSYMEHGVLVPIEVRRNGMRQGKPIIEVVDGRTRTKGLIVANERLKAAGQPERLISAVYKATDDDTATTHMILLNELRKTEDHVTRAERLQRHLDSGFSESDAKRTWGLTSSSLRSLLAVMEMSTEVRDALRAKRITIAIARKLTALPRAEQSEVLASLLEEGKTARGKAATAKANERVKGAAKPKAKSYKRIKQALDDASCLPNSAYRDGVLHALEWAMGARETSWAPLPKKGANK